MDATELRGEIESEYETELSRLGSSKSMYAATEGEMETDAVLSAMADRAHSTAETFDTWTAETTDAVLADVFGSLAADQHAQAERIVDAGGEAAVDSPTALQEHLRDLSNPAERVGGMLAWTLVIDRTLSQAVGFFVGNADPSSADLFRDFRTDIERAGDRGEETLDRVCDDREEWDLAEVAANEAIEAAYAEYVDTLESMGVKVKPVC
ncbi:MAG: rubrerythrin family protein [Halobacteriales archaeon]